ncbi:MAG: hypothetical protein DRH08_05705 [Deltaproteobacteria bacterium]|nr:MAG: hypothetical protein DRH08_05705 [Deltaproteobacteria bacterium]
MKIPIEFTPVELRGMIEVMSQYSLVAGYESMDTAGFSYEDLSDLERRFKIAWNDLNDPEEPFGCKCHYTVSPDVETVGCVPGPIQLVPEDDYMEYGD